jgi:hypothetical protein
MNKAFIDGNIWEIDAYQKNGVEYNYYTLTNIFYYNSLEDKTFTKFLSHMRTKPFIYILTYQIPQQIINGLEIEWKIEDKNHVLYGYKTIKDFIIENKNYIIKNKHPIIKRNINDKWSVDLNMLFYDKNINWKK